ncbi:hypothetical protein EVG20_g2777 [Dentipellis fragilis]|uniref:F-box domain-containing protein n=1 Tax=Dentipellis fragilis TaxID=205917 RepID=A0A4Y9Z8R0_9AGAM|nr:hypothetical protein EVG20_g2777 [Dentipellis fragilis]
MGQDWCLVNLDKKQHLHVWQLGETMLDDPISRHILLGRLPSVKLLPYFKPPPASPTPIKLKGLDSLPNELVDEILSYRQAPADCVRFALTSRRYWNLARPHIRRTIIGLFEYLSWAGDRIICIGDYTQLDDYPPALTATDTERFTDKLGLYSIARHEYEEVCRRKGAWATLGESRLRRRLKKRLELDNALPDDKYGYPTSRIFTQCVVRKDIPQDQLVLRNFSKREYVRYDELPTDMKHEHWKGGQVDLGLAMHSQICWSSDPGIGMEYDGGLHRGPWAGDRFDIAPIDELRELEKEKDEEGKPMVWTDASERVADELWEILESEFASKYDHAILPYADPSRAALRAQYAAMFPEYDSD